MNVRVMGNKRNASRRLIDVLREEEGGGLSLKLLEASELAIRLYTIVHFKRLGSRVSHDSFNQYLLFFSKQYTYCKTNAIYT